MAGSSANMKDILSKSRQPTEVHQTYSPFDFCGLPFEIRILIYEIIFWDSTSMVIYNTRYYWSAYCERLFSTHHLRPLDSLGILTVSRQISAEALTIMRRTRAPAICDDSLPYAGEAVGLCYPLKEGFKYFRNFVCYVDMDALGGCYRILRVRDMVRKMRAHLPRHDVCVDFVFRYRPPSKALRVLGKPTGSEMTHSHRERQWAYFYALREAQSRRVLAFMEEGSNAVRHNVRLTSRETEKTSNVEAMLAHDNAYVSSRAWEYDVRAVFKDHERRVAGRFTVVAGESGRTVRTLEYLPADVYESQTLKQMVEKWRVGLGREGVLDFEA